MESCCIHWIDCQTPFFGTTTPRGSSDGRKVGNLSSTAVFCRCIRTAASSCLGASMYIYIYDKWLKCIHITIIIYIYIYIHISRDRERGRGKKMTVYCVCGLLVEGSTPVRDPQIVNSMVMPQKYVDRWRFPFRHGGTPSHHPFIDGFFYYKPWCCITVLTCFICSLRVMKEVMLQSWRWKRPFRPIRKGLRAFRIGGASATLWGNSDRSETTIVRGWSNIVG